MVKALILKVFRVRRKDTPTIVMCTHFHHESVLYILPSHAEEREQETVAKEVRGLKSVPPLANITDGTTHKEG